MNTIKKRFEVFHIALRNYEGDVAQPVNGRSIWDSVSWAELTDTGNALRFCVLHSGDVRYCAKTREWFLWDGSRWKVDETGEILNLAAGTVSTMLTDALKTQDNESRHRRVKWALSSESAHRLKALLELAGAKLPIRIEEMDSDPWLFNCANGTIDLTTGGFSKPNPDHYITKMSPVVYDPEATCPLWESFISRIMASRLGLVRFIQRAIGWSLSGDQSEHALFILYGKGANGKSTLLNTIRGMMGNYGLQMDSTTLLQQKHDNS